MPTKLQLRMTVATAASERRLAIVKVCPQEADLHLMCAFTACTFAKGIVSHTSKSAGR